MKILLIDTCGETGSVALADNGNLIASAVLPGRSASEGLIATVRQLTVEAKIALSDLGAIVVVHGPGSFTGVRVGVSAAKGLSEALGIPVVAISRLEVLAHGAQQTIEQVTALLDAGRGEFYCGIYDGERLVREAVLTQAEARNAARGTQIAVCRRDAAAFAETHAIVVEDLTVAAALPIVLRRIAAGRFDDVATLDANYLRRTDAEIFAKPHPARTQV